MAYQPMFNYQTPQPYYQPPEPPRQPQGGMVWVRSEEEALNWPVFPNSALPLWHSNLPIVYLKQADAAGRPSIKAFDLVERGARPTQEPTAVPAVDYATREEMSALDAKIGALARQMEAMTAKPAKKTKEDAE